MRTCDRPHRGSVTWRGVVQTIQLKCCSLRARSSPSNTPTSLARAKTQSVSAGQVVTKTAYTSVDVNNITRKTPNVGVVGDATACVTASSVSAVASGNVDVSSKPLTKKTAGKAWSTYQWTISRADLDYRRGVCGAKGCDGHTVSNRTAKDAEPKY